MNINYEDLPEKMQRQVDEQLNNSNSKGRELGKKVRKSKKGIKGQAATKKPLKPKYKNKKTIVDGIKFDSKKEAERYKELVLMQEAGEIKGLLLQPVYILQEKFIDNQGIKHKAITYKADFSYLKDIKEIVEDVKGFETDVFKIKEKLFLKRYPELIFKKI